MHTLNRILMALLLLMVLVPPMTFALVTLDEQQDAKQSLEHAIGTAVTRYQQRSGLQAAQSKAQRVKLEQESAIAHWHEEKIAVRRALATEMRIVREIERRYGIRFSSKEQIAQMLEEQKRLMSRVLRLQYLRSVPGDDAMAEDAVLGAIFAQSGQPMSVVTERQMDFLRDLTTAEEAFWQSEILRARREEVLAQYWEAQRTYDEAERLIERSEAQLENIRQIMADVHAQVLSLQGELARIDARLRRKAERALIEKGLLDPKIGNAPAVPAAPTFSWPVYGRRSAGFLNPDYERHFGVPHHGLDIAVGQGTPVASAADGVVFLVRDGGATGYTYVLIGHRGGYATLYGHLRTTSVVAGQEVSVGEYIGTSGGQPGTPGAGPMTTGAHLHFEVIQAGVNVDPESVLP